MAEKYRKLILATGDLVLMYLALAVALWIRGGSDFLAQTWQNHVWSFSLLHIIWILILYVDGFYSLPRLRLNTAFLQSIFRIAAFSALTGIVFFYVFNVFGITPKTVLAIHISSFIVLFTAWRLLAGRFFRFSGLRQPAVLLEMDGEIAEMAADLTDDPFSPFRVVAICQSDQPGLCQTILKHQAETVIVSEQAWCQLPPEIYDLALSGVRIIDASSFWEEHRRQVRPEGGDLTWFLAGFRNVRKLEYEAGKRTVELIAAIALGLVLAPLILLIAIGIKLSDRGPVLFTQHRVGLFGKTFKVVKFRTMIQDAEKNGPQWTDKNDLRVTRLGQLLRHTHLDEIPQLWNVIKGEMSFTGPRPERPVFVKELRQELPHYGLRHLTRPGITGWAQINYRYGSSIQDAAEKLTYDLWYVKHRTAAIDLKITLKTITMLFRGEGR